MLNVFQFDKDITEISTLVQSDTERKWIAVCPSPQKSDMFRDIINDIGLGLNVEVITISKFVNDILALQKDISRTGKSELLVDLWTLWKIKINNDYEKFRFCFDLFTEIRSYSLDGTIIESLKDLLEPQNLEGVNLFNAYFISQEIIDEQQSYRLVGELIESSNLGQSYMFWGFDHLNSNQIDMIKEVSNYTDVCVPVAKSVMAGCDNLDWPFWLTTQEAKDFEPREIIVKSYEVPKGRVSEYLENIVEEDERYSLIHVDKSLDLYRINSLYADSQNFKTNYDLFDKALEEVMEELLEIFKNGRRIKSDEFVKKTDELVSLALKNDDLLQFKVGLTFKDLMNQYIERSSLNEFFEVADLKCLKEVMSLDLPRSSVVSLTKEDNKSILERDFLLKKFDDDERKFLFVEKGSAGALQDSSKFSTEILSVFSAYGPLQTKKYEVLNLSHQLENFFSSNGELIFESGAFDTSVEWEEILKNINFENTVANKEDKVIRTVKKLSRPGEVGVLSATKVQSYLDCPRKYYYDYVQRIDIRARSTDVIGADMKGVVEHEVIETYVKNHCEWSEEIHSSVVDSVFDSFIEKSRVNPSLIGSLSAKTEVIAYTAKPIRKLLDLQKTLGAKCDFEVDIANFSENTSGSIDLVITHADKLYVFDFKRSSFGVPTKKDFESYQKIQLWYYLQILSDQDKPVAGFGYINLSEFEKSLMYSCDSESSFFDIFAHKMKISGFKNTFQEIITEFKDSFSQTIKAMENDCDFFPNPKDGNVCNFCVAASVCPKGMQGERV